MKKYVCTDACTFGNPPKFYSVGDSLILDGKCPRHFSAATEAVKKAVPDEPPKQTLGEADPASTTVADLAKKTAPEGCTVEKLSRDLNVDVEVVKTASGKTNKRAMLTTEEVSAATEAIKKALSEG